MTGVRVLPGRAGRLRLRRQLAVANRGADLLQQRLQILRREEQRFQLLVERTEQEWARSCREAERWTLRAALSGSTGVVVVPLLVIGVLFLIAGRLSGAGTVPAPAH